MEEDDRKQKEQSIKISRAASLMGKKGGDKNRENHDPQYFKELGKKGFEARQKNMGNDLKARMEKRKAKGV